MSLKLTDLGATQLLTRAFKNVLPAGGADYMLCLYCNSVVLTDILLLNNIAEIPPGCGYAAVPLLAADFVISTVDGIASASYATQTFTFTGPIVSETYDTVYGYFIKDADNTLILIEQTTTPFTPLTAGETVSVTVVIPLSSGTPV